jgi:hypothetical protein
VTSGRNYSLSIGIKNLIDKIGTLKNGGGAIVASSSEASDFLRGMLNAGGIRRIGVRRCVVTACAQRKPLCASLAHNQGEQNASETSGDYAEKTIHSAPRVAMMSQIPMVFLSGTPAGAGGRWG